MCGSQLIWTFKLRSLMSVANGSILMVTLGWMFDPMTGSWRETSGGRQVIAVGGSPEGLITGAECPLCPSASLLTLRSLHTCSAMRHPHQIQG